MKHFFLDSTIVLDFLLRRDPFAAPAADLFQLAEEQKIMLSVSSLSFSHTFYILRKIVGSAKARALLLDLSELVSIAAVDSQQVKAALRSATTDFEDAIQYYAATTGSGPAPDGIITRDPKGFSDSRLPVLAPAEALSQLS